MNITQKSLLTVFVLFMAISSAQATTVVIRIAPKEIVVAADSKWRDISVGDYVADKIISIGPNGFMAAAGILELQFNALSDFDVFRSARSCKSAGTKEAMQSFANSCSKEISEELSTELRAGRLNRPDWYDRLVYNKVILDIGFFGREEGQLKAYMREIFHDPITDALRIKNFDFEGQRDVVAAWGYSNEIDSVLTHQRDYWNRTSTTTAACTLVSLEIQKHPEAVGWPVKVLRLTHNGSKWITFEKSCDETSPNPAPQPKRAPVKRKKRG